MAHIIIPEKWSKQPSGLLSVNWNNPLTTKLEVAYEVSNGEIIHNIILPSDNRIGNGLLVNGITTGSRPGSILNNATFDQISCLLLCSNVQGVASGEIRLNYASDRLLAISVNYNATLSYSGGDYSNYRQVTSTAWAPAGRVLVVGRADAPSDTQSLRVNGAEVAFTKYGVAVSSIATGSALSNIKSNHGSNAVIGTALAYIWTRRLDDLEARELEFAPWQLFKPRKRIAYFDVGGGASTITLATSLSAAVQQAHTATASLGSAVRQEHTNTASIDAAVRRALSISGSLDSAVQSGHSVTAGADAAIQQGHSAIAGIDAAIQKAFILSAALDSAIQQAKTAAASLDAYVFAGGTLVTTSLDAALQYSRAATASVDSVISKAQSAVASLDAALSITHVSTVGLDAYVHAATQALLSLDAAIQVSRAVSVGLDAYISDGTFIPVVSPSLVAALSRTLTLAAAARTLQIEATQ